MKTLKVKAGLFFAIISPYLLFSQITGGIPGAPQVWTNYPPGPIVVGIKALDPIAAEPGDDTASFQVYRFGDVSNSLMVAYSISGTASNGVDYAQIPDSITIPAGSNSAIITITPIDDNIAEPTETVIIALKESADYSFDVTSSGIIANRAYVRIFDNETNTLPKVAIIQPSQGDTFQLPTNVVIKAEAKDEDGMVQKVGFFANGSLLGYFYNTNNTGAEFSFVWQNPPAGDFVLTARAYDNVGAEQESQPVSISIKPQIPERDIVTIEVVDGEAEEIPPVPPGMGMPQRVNNGVVRIHRGGPTNFPLYVSYSLSGTASNGIDYARLSGIATIPTGSRTANLEIIPIYDNIVEDTETVIIRIEPPICIAIYPTPPDCYLVGEPAEALVKIVDSQLVTNITPKVAITKPEDGSVFTAPANIVLNVEASDKDGYVETVEFWANDTKLCTITNIPESARAVSPFFYVWTNVPPGEYTLKAVATDNEGACESSLPVKINVRAPTNHLPIVTIVATDSEASELPDVTDAINPGIFTVRRTGPVDLPLTVYYQLGGSAINGKDYKELSGTVEIPSGQAYANIEVVPIDDNIAEGTESVTATLIVPEVVIAIYPPPPPPYIIGEPKKATVYIYDNETCPTNIAPVVRITKPRNGMTFVAPANIGIFAEAFDRDGKIKTVEFYEGTNKIGDALSPTNISSALYPYYFMWKDVVAGDYILTAIATDDDGESTKSEPVRIKVIEPITNTTPVVNIKTVDGLACEGPFTPIVIHTNYSSAGFLGPEIITNRVPDINTATFLVIREGPTNSELTVNYMVSGTASNGIDYLTLSGIVIIPEGLRYATITVVPIEDSIREGAETVTLTLVPPISTNNVPGSSNTKLPYQIGAFEKASAVIVDNDFPVCPIRLPDGQFHIYRNAPTGMVYTLEVSADLIHWTPIITNTATEGFINYVDTDSPDYKRRFYRVIPVQ